MARFEAAASWPTTSVSWVTTGTPTTTFKFPDLEAPMSLDLQAEIRLVREEQAGIRAKIENEFDLVKDQIADLRKAVEDLTYGLGKL